MVNYTDTVHFRGMSGVGRGMGGGSERTLWWWCTKLSTIVLQRERGERGGRERWRRRGEREEREREEGEIDYRYY